MLDYVEQNTPEGVRFARADLSQVPFYNGDFVETPAAVTHLFSQMAQADAFLFACPEYNYSIAPALKNAIDWGSRAKDNYLLGAKPAALMGAGGGMGTSRAQYHLRQVCVFVDLRVLNKPEVFLSAFGDAFDKETGAFIGEAEQGRVDKLVAALVQAVKDQRAVAAVTE